MKQNLLNRREFVRGAVGAAMAVSTLRGWGAMAAPKLRLGGPAYAKADDPEAYVLAHRKLGYRAAFCPKLALTETDRIRVFEQAFAKHDVIPAEVGRWCNLLDADPAKRAQNLANVTEGLALADALGARCCVDIAGSFHPTIWYGPHADNLTERFFDATVENARKIIDAVKPKRAKFTYEMMGWAMPDTADCYLRMVKAVDRPAFGVHLDPCNAVNSPEKFFRNTALLNECFDKLGPWIASCHAKDLTWDVEMNVHFREVAPGKGTLDYATYLKRLAQLPAPPPLMLEHLAKPEEYAGARDHIVSVGKQHGLAFE